MNEDRDRDSDSDGRNGLAMGVKVEVSRGGGGSWELRTLGGYCVDRIVEYKALDWASKTHLRHSGFSA